MLALVFCAKPTRLPISVQQLKVSLVIDGFVALVPVNHPDNSEIFALFLNELLRDNRC
jgi:hypothetical protein